jgi:hypothetical protein
MHLQIKEKYMNATNLFYALLVTSDPQPFFQTWNEIDEPVYVEFSELLFQDPPSAHFAHRFEFVDERAYPFDYKRLDWLLELGQTLELDPVKKARYQNALNKYEVWALSRQVDSLVIDQSK